MSAVRSLRRELTGIFIATAAAIVLAAALGMWFTVRYAVWAPVRTALHEELEAIEEQVEARPDDLAAMVKAIAAEHEPGPNKFVRVTLSDGRLVSSGVRPPGAESEGRPGFHRWRNDGRSFLRLRSAERRGASIEIGVGVDRQVGVLRRCAAAIVGAAVALLAALAALASAVTRRATRDLEDLVEELRTIEVGGLDRRLVARRTQEVDRLASALNRLLERLQVAVEELKRFAADAAHELRTPIAGLRAHLELALSAARPVERVYARLLDALERTEQLSNLAEELLALGTVENAAAAGGLDVPLHAIVEEVADSLRPLAEEQGRPFAVQAESGIPVRGAPALLRRLLLNLVDNAFRHTPPSVAVTVSVARNGGSAELRVHDEGPGISAAELPRIFERFHRMGPGAGSGLGLALCREIVLRHAGEIELTSEAGSGTTVRVRLPLAG